MNPNNPPPTNQEDLQKLFLAGIQAKPVTIGEGVPFIVVPEGFKVAALERLMTAPLRPRAAAALLDAESFVSYVQKFDDGRTLLSAAEGSLAVVAILDYHSGRGPSFGEHVVKLALEYTDEWKTWIASNKKQMNQVAFAQFIEDNLPDIASPPGAELLEVATGLKVDKKVNFLSSQRLSDGQREFIYQEAQEASSSKAAVRVPETFKVGVAPFVGAPKYQLDARLRFRLEEGKLSLWYDLLRPHKVVEDAFDNLVKEIEAGLKQRALRGGVTVGSCVG